MGPGIRGRAGERGLKGLEACLVLPGELLELASCIVGRLAALTPVAARCPHLNLWGFLFGWITWLADVRDLVELFDPKLGLAIEAEVKSTAVPNPPINRVFTSNGDIYTYPL